jgi:hypothetical protein
MAAGGRGGIEVEPEGEEGVPNSEHLPEDEQRGKAVEKAAQKVGAKKNTVRGVAMRAETLQLFGCIGFEDFAVWSNNGDGDDVVEVSRVRGVAMRAETCRPATVAGLLW